MSSAPVICSEPGDPTLRSAVPWLGVSSSDSGSRKVVEYHHLMHDLEADDDKFRTYFRLNKEQFDEVLDLIDPDIKKEYTTFRELITSRERLPSVLEPAVEGLIIVLFMEALLLEGLFDGTGLAAPSHSLYSSAAAITLSIATFALLSCRRGNLRMD
ncbi:hypothetical protein J6590_093671 [Homalodisca vitripennis]|nr:hypothetical protein J6590_093671 [Homalodisca vitripennis]